MSVFPNRKTFAIPAAMALLALAVPTAPVQAQEDSWVSNMETTAIVALTGGDYAWWVDVSQPAPALLSEYYDEGASKEVPVPTDNPGWAEYINTAKLLTVTFDWGDESEPGVLRSDTPMNEPSVQGQLRCDNSVALDGETWVPTGSFGRGCTAEGWHTYAAGTQGVKTIRVTATQVGQEQAPDYTYEQLVIDLSAGGSLRGQGTLEGRSGGMYDQQFPQGSDDTTVTFNVTAKRRSGTAATQASVLVTAPGMHPDSSSEAKGMTFKGTAALRPLFVMKTRSGIELILDAVEGRVTNTLGNNVNNPAGSARAMIHVNVQKGWPTLMRIMINNTSAGYTYLDTGYQPTSMYQALNPGFDVLLSGSVKVG
jgi:hypothetical protein